MFREQTKEDDIWIKLDKKKSKHYVATMFDAKTGKIDAYVQTGRLKKVPKVSKDPQNELSLTEAPTPGKIKLHFILLGDFLLCI